MFLSFAEDTVVVVRPAWVRDERGNRVADWKAGTRTVVEECLVQPGDSLEVMGGVGDSFGGRESVSVRFSVFMPYGSVVDATDGMEVAGRQYQVNGEPKPFNSPAGSLSYLLVKLIDWKG